MRDAVSLLQQFVVIEDQTYEIVGFYHVPGNPELYVKLKSEDGNYLNYQYRRLQQTIEEQVKL